MGVYLCKSFFNLSPQRLRPLFNISACEISLLKLKSVFIMYRTKD